MTDTILEYWAILMGFVGFVVWVIRLEGGSVENPTEIRRLWNQRREALEASKAAREAPNAMLAAIRDDIKALTAKVGPE